MDGDAICDWLLDLLADNDTSMMLLLLDCETLASWLPLWDFDWLKLIEAEMDCTSDSDFDIDLDRLCDLDLNMDCRDALSERLIL